MEVELEKRKFHSRKTRQLPATHWTVPAYCRSAIHFLCRATDCNRDQAWYRAESIYTVIRFGSLPYQQQSLYCLADRQVLPDQQYSRPASGLCELPEVARHGSEII